MNAWIQTKVTGNELKQNDNQLMLINIMKWNSYSPNFK